MNIDSLVNSDGKGSITYNGCEVKYFNKIFDHSGRSIFVALEDPTMVYKDAMEIISQLEKVWAVHNYKIIVMLRMQLGFAVLKELQQNYIVVAHDRFCSLYRWNLCENLRINGIKMIKIKPNKVIAGVASTIVEDGILVEG